MTPSEIALIVAKHTGITIEQMKSKVTTMEVTAARQCAMYLCERHVAGTSHLAIASFFNRHKSAVFVARENVKGKISINDGLFYWCKHVDESLRVDAPVPENAPLMVVIKLVQEAKGVTLADMRSPSRVTDIKVARHCAMWLMYRYFDGAVSYPVIGKFMNRDHSTVIHAVQTVDNMLETNDRAYTWVKRMINGSKYVKSPADNGDDWLNLLSQIERMIDFGNIEGAKNKIQEAKLFRKITLDSLESMKADQMLHEQTNQ